MILVTGATGFVGRALLPRLLSASQTQRIVVAVRTMDRQWPDRVLPRVVGDLGAAPDLSSALSGVTRIIHCAARAHVLADTAKDQLEAFRRVNVEGTLNLARQSAAAGVRRFLFISSIGVNGAETTLRPFATNDVAAPHSPYAISKLEAEIALRQLSQETGMTLTIIRPPLVYGFGAPGNFGLLLRWLRRGLPLPLGSVRNRRSLVSRENLVDLIATCLDHPEAANRLFLVSDDDDISTPELLRRITRLMGRSARLVPVPAGLLRGVAAMLGHPGIAQSLCASLQVDITETRRLLGWKPPLGLEQGLRNAVLGTSPGTEDFHGKQ